MDSSAGWKCNVPRGSIGSACEIQVFPLSPGDFQLPGPSAPRGRNCPCQVRIARTDEALAPDAEGCGRRQALERRWPPIEAMVARNE